jgi:hypothetical protein
MFGHQDTQPTTQDDQPADSTLPTEQAVSPSDTSTPAIAAVSTDEEPAGNPWQHPGAALDSPSLETDSDVISPAGGFPQALSKKEPVAPAEPAHPVPPDNQLADATDEELIEVKQKALDELFPLIDKLDQTPEERFRTIMMIIQASDNHTLIEKAYQIAQTIDDEKVRAQALLDIVNEINYFTQQPQV